MIPNIEQVKLFAELLTFEQVERLKEQDIACQGNIDNAQAEIKEGKKYTKVNVNRSGKYMIDNITKEIFGIKGYNSINKKKKYGTLDTIKDWYWGGYVAYKREDNSCGGYGCEEEDNG